MLGQGLYEVAEVSRFTGLNANRVRTWFKQRSDGSGCGPIFAADYEPVNGDFAVSFYDLIDVLVAGEFRDRYGVPMRIVRRAHSLLQTQLGTKHPFCHSDLYTDGRRIFLCVATQLHEEVLSDVVSRQQFFLHIKEKLDHVDYNEVTKLAARWRILKGVVIDPMVGMGKPTIENTGITTYVVANQYYANAKNTTLVADLYGIRETDVGDAVEFENIYGGRRAA